MARPFRTVRARAALAATAVVAAALLVAGIAVTLALRANLQNQAGLEAEVAAREVASRLATGTPVGKLDLDEDHPVQVVDEDDRVCAVSEDLQAISGTVSGSVRPACPADGAGSGSGDDDDEADDPGESEVSDDDPELTDGSATIDGERGPYRFAAVETTTAAGATYTVYAGASLETQQSAVSTAVRSMLIGLPPLLAVVAGVTWLVTRRALRPVEGIRGEMAAITASTDLSRRVPEPDSGDEIARLARTTNETLTALEASVDRQRRFVADASHELRSPIASLRTQLEVAEAHPELLDIGGAVADTVRLQGLAADLLLLARLDAGEEPRNGQVSLADVVREAAGRRSKVHCGELDEVEITGSRGQLERVLANLLDNAERHAADRVDVSLRREEGKAVLRVADDGPGVPAADRERIFERFVRLDEARARDDGGAGLGLAIVRDVVVRHGGQVTVGDGPRGGACFTMRLPAVR
ncbi:HAMP domain-containing histidine kinase [Streptomyces sp. A7024]|uniref:histidine kinase n=1 Tax=Streptomyces coryli TaxID=1128680 RepID=A0A6G4U939_9ACTN|nr:HAMP domain-containing sensor histidine kinase [Streptomyces coryli]NGN68240.1 HAMP domain-containing histidine kinase [Streptomyces coryli]